MAEKEWGKERKKLNKLKNKGRHKNINYTTETNKTEKKLFYELKITNKIS